MSVIAIVALSVGYALAGILCARLVAGHLAWVWAENESRQRSGYRSRYSDSEIEPHPDGEQWFGAICIGALCGLAWPAMFLSLLPIRRWTIGAEARNIARKRDERIAALERELDLR